jgi:hypothetical protein
VNLAERSKAAGKGQWYFVTYYDCPLCWRSDVYRERRKGPKPKDWTKRQKIVDRACSGHFL